MKRWLHSGRELGALAWPVLIGQIAVLAYSTVDTLMLGRLGSDALAALAVGSSVFFSVFVGFMGMVLAIGPIAGRLFGAREPRQAGWQMTQCQWLALMLSIPGTGLLLWPEPFLWMAQLNDQAAESVRAYLRPLAFALAPALLFTAYRGFNTAVSRPKAVMALQVGGLLLKIPLTAALVYGVGPVPALGAQGCSWATALVMTAQWLIGEWVLHRDPFYRPFAFQSWWRVRPAWPDQWALLKLGLPLGGSVLVEVTGFTFMAIFIARLGPTPVAGHQIAVNLVAMMFMVPLALSNAATTLVSQALGAKQWAMAAQIGRHALLWGLVVATVLGGWVALWREPILRLYTSDAAAIAAALPLLVWLWVFHIGDSLQYVAAGVLRAHHVVNWPMGIYVFALWGVGIGGGNWLAFRQGLGAVGFWMSATVGLLLAGSLLSALQIWVEHQSQRTPSSPTSERLG
ncbi:MATE family efflux transporter [Inhella gelatinilytica]|uniref:MATE family efflux transporter n=1 Tax=Inhella gelatinilytica TaxID=2795030 RepID=UPI002873B0A9|nr:MATE family efflux transporter [Inhella gelatinilytica]